MPILTSNSAHNAAPPAPSFPEQVVLLADDLTGACDAAAAFLPTGLAVRVWLGAAASFPAAEPVQAFNTDSRSLTPARASRIVARTASALASNPRPLLFKKVDSAARGPFASEILAAHRAFGARAVLFAPAFPAAGRTVQNGILEIQDPAGQLTRIKIASLFPQSARSLICHVTRPQELAAAFDTGKPILLCDATSQSDLEDLVRAADQFPDLLFAGSAGLAHALASRNARHTRTLPPPSAARTFIVVGSDHPVTKLQLQTLQAIDPIAVQVLRTGLNASGRARILDAFRTFAPQALILTGGDTALFAANTLGAHSFILQGELAPGIPWGIVQGGMAEGCIVITKSGGFGAPAIFNEILSTLRGPV